MAEPHPNEFSVPVPFRAHLQGKIEPGQTLFTHGNIPDGATRFEVNFLSGSPTIDPHVGDVVLHVSVRFDEGKIVFNTMKQGEWGKEERVSNPWKAGQPFDLRVRAHSDKYEILADQKEIHEFNFRLPLESINYLEINGNVTLTGVHWGGRYFNLPYEAGFPGGALRPGQRIYINGVPQGKRFNVDLLGQNGDILFHFNPRFDEKHVVRNSSIGGAWGQEEREGPFPFVKEKAFDLVIINEPYSIQLYANKQHLGTFAHRTSNPENDYVGLRVAGDVELTGLDFSH